MQPLPPRTLDIIIPVYGRLPAFKKTLQALEQQTMPLTWRARLIVIDDGSDEHVYIQECVETFHPVTSQWEKPVYQYINHQGIAHARNQALVQATADIIFFLGADILLQPNTLSHHIHFHEHTPANQGALGFIMWDPFIHPSPFMQWMTHGGPQNNFDEILHKKTVDPKHFFYASHISIKREALAGLQFDEGYTQYGWEDLDMGFELSQRGVALTPLPQAIGFHRHQYDHAALYKRQYQAGMSFRIYQQKHASYVQPIPAHGLRFLKHRLAQYGGITLLATIIVFIGRRYTWPKLYLFLTTHWFLRGIWDNKKAV